MSWLGLATKTAIVTGAGSGIGAAVATALVRDHGCRVIAADANPIRLEALLLEHSTYSTSDTMTAVTCNVGNPQDVQALFDQHQDEPSTLLINCAGITRDALCTSMTDQQWNQVMEVNLYGTFLMCRAFLQQPVPVASSTRDSSRCIVNVGSVVSEQGNMGQVNYAASKGGVLGLTRALAKEYASRQVRVNAVVPGFINTEMVQAIPDKVKAQILSKVALGRYGTPEDVASLILFLASSKRSGFITGECIECSGMIAL